MANERELLLAILSDDEETKKRLIEEDKPVDMLKIFIELEQLNKELTQEVFDGLTDPAH